MSDDPDRDPTEAAPSEDASNADTPSEDTATEAASNADDPGGDASGESTHPGDAPTGDAPGENEGEATSAFTDRDAGTSGERVVYATLAAFGVLLVGALAVGLLSPTYFLYLLSLAGMYMLLSLGLNVQWGYAGLINFSVAAFFGLGAYTTALLSANGSPIAGGYNPLVGLVVAVVAAVVLALAIGIPTLSLREDYLAIASLGLAEVVRLVVRNQQAWTNGTSGLGGIPGFFEGWPVLASFPREMPTVDLGVYTLGIPFWQALLNLVVVGVFVAAAYAVLRRVHRSPWGRVLRTIRSDEDVAEALGKDTFAFRMQAFVLGSVVMTLAGVFYAHWTLYITPELFNPIYTFYAWIAVILGGSGSNRGALFGGVVLVIVNEGPRFLNQIIGGVDSLLPFVALNVSLPPGPMRLLSVGAIIVLFMRYRPEGVLPPRKELIWPAALRGGSSE